MIIGVPKELHPGECRVALSPDATEKLVKLGFQLHIQSEAGELAQFTDSAYLKVGAKIVSNPKELWTSSDIILKVRAPAIYKDLNVDEIDWMKEGAWLISFIWPAQNPLLLEKLRNKKATVLAMDCVPRISRAQKLDALSSMANIAGYRAVIEAAHQFGRFFTGQVTAAGKIPPAKVFVIGAGVAGLSSIGAASSLGAIVRATDTRSEVADQIKSMGGIFVEVPFKEDGSSTSGYAKVMSDGFQKAQRELITRQCEEVDIIISTALIPGKPAPLLITKEMISKMKKGSVIVDLAAEQGGNCEATVSGTISTYEGVKIIGFSDLPSRLPTQSSNLYANNILRLIEELCLQKQNEKTNDQLKLDLIKQDLIKQDLIKQDQKLVDPKIHVEKKQGQIHLNMNDEMIRGTTVIANGVITWPPPPISVTSASNKLTQNSKSDLNLNEAKKKDTVSHLSVRANLEIKKLLFIISGVALIFYLIGFYAPAAFVSHLTVFVLACFVGYMVVWNVTASLHTPLMSVTNAISSIIIVGALLQTSSSNKINLGLSLLAILLTTINMAGGFWVTQRMLNMFKKPSS